MKRLSGWVILLGIVVPGLVLTVWLGQWNPAPNWPVWPFQLLALALVGGLVAAFGLRALRR